MHVHFLGEPDNGISVSSHHAHSLRASGATVSFEEDSCSWRNVCRKTNVIHLVTQRQANSEFGRKLLAARRSGLEIVRFWTGSDILWAKYHHASREFAKLVTQLKAKQFARNESAVDALEAQEIHADIGPVVDLRICNTIEPQPFPKVPTVLCDLHSPQRCFRGGGIIDDLIRQMRQIRFLILRDHDTDYSLHENVESLDTVSDVSRAIKRATVTVIPRLDGGMSRLALESLCHGRHVISSADIPFCQTARTAKECVSAIQGIVSKSAFNLDGREYVCHQFGRKHTRDALWHLMEACVSPNRIKRSLVGQLVGASAIVRNPGLYLGMDFSPPDPDSLCPDSGAMRALLVDAQRQEPIVA